MTYPQSNGSLTRADDPEDQNTSPTRRWSRTFLKCLGRSVEFPSGDRRLEDDSGQPLARLYRQTGGPQGGRWMRFVHVDPEGRAWNGGTGLAEMGKEAREAVEALVPVGVIGRISGLNI
jgi:hypothetical protein